MHQFSYLVAAGLHQRNLSFPSYVPDYTHPETHYSLAPLHEDSFNRTGTHMFQATDQADTSAQLFDNSHTIELRGKILRKIRGLAQPFHSFSHADREPVPSLNLQANDLQQQIQECRIMVESCKSQSGGVSPSTVLRLTLTFDIENPKWRILIWRSFHLGVQREHRTTIRCLREVQQYGEMIDSGPTRTEPTAR